MLDELKLNQACREIHKAAIEKGFEPQPVPTNLMLIVSELGEACEADRKDEHADFSSYDFAYKQAMEDWDGTLHKEQTAFKEAFEASIKDTFEDEIADAFMRLMDLCGALNIDIEQHIKMKAAYNKTRQSKHGKRY